MSPYGPPTANEHLRASIHGSINFRSQMVNDYAPPGPDIVERRLPLWVAVPAAMLAGCAMWIGIVWALGWLATASAAEQPRPWIVWDIDANKPWVSAKGYQSTATGPTACSLNLHEASKASPSGSRLSCRRIEQRKEQ